jgi:hypothetical protein
LPGNTDAGALEAVGVEELGIVVVGAAAAGGRFGGVGAGAVGALGGGDLVSDESGVVGSVGHLLSERMKGKGRSWSPAGVHHMVKVQELLVNEEIEHLCYRSKSIAQAAKHSKGKSGRRRTDGGEWLQDSVPALHGPAENAAWVERLRHKIHPPHLPN